jgi:hypothetical protein
VQPSFALSLWFGGEILAFSLWCSVSVSETTKRYSLVGWQACHRFSGSLGQQSR